MNIMFEEIKKENTKKTVKTTHCLQSWEMIMCFFSLDPTVNKHMAHCWSSLLDS